MNAVDAGGPCVYSGHWNGGKLFLDVSELNIQAGNYNAEELAAQLPREIERALRESPHLRHTTALLPHAGREASRTGGFEPPIQTSATTPGDIADVIVNWLCAKLYQVVGEENLADAAARVAELRALREHTAITGPIRSVRGYAPVMTTPAATPKTYAELQETYRQWLAKQGLEDPDGWLLWTPPDGNDDEKGEEEPIPADFEGLDAWYAQREEGLTGPFKDAYMAGTFTQGFLAGAGGIVLDLLVTAGRFFNGTVLYPLSGGNFFREDHAFAVLLSQELFALPINLLTGNVSEALRKQLDMLLARLNAVKSSYGKGKALAELLALVAGFFTPEGLATNPALTGRLSSLGKLLGKGKSARKVKVVKIVTAEEVNALNPPNGLWDVPFLKGTRVRLVKLREDMVFLRFKTATNYDTGSFLVRAKEIKDMTPERIYKHLALESVPTHVQSVTVPKGTLLYHGRIGPQAKMGHPDKGGWQFRVTKRLDVTQFGPWREL